MKCASVAISMVIMLLGSPALAGPLQIESNQLEIRHAKHQATFTGNVHLVRDDFELWSNKLIAYYQADSGEIERAEAYDHVRIRKADKHGSSDKAVLDNLKQTITLIGNARMEEEGGWVQGSTIVHDIESNQTEVLQGTTGRVKMRLDSKSDALKQAKP